MGWGYQSLSTGAVAAAAPKRNLTDSDLLQIEQAASGCIDGTSDDWPALRAAIQKITGKPFGPRKSAQWLQGFCEGVMIQNERT